MNVIPQYNNWSFNYHRIINNIKKLCEETRYGSGARFSQSRNVKKWRSTHETESKYCSRIRSLLVSKIFTNFAGITQPVFSLPSADFVAAVKTRQISQRANYSCRKTNQRSFDNAFVYILYFAPFMNTHTNGCLQYHVAVETLTKLVIKKFLQLFFLQAMGSYLKKLNT